MKRFSLALFAIFFTAPLPHAGHAAEPNHIASHGDWHVYTLAAGSGKTCYIGSKPANESGNYNRRGEPYALVTHRSAGVDEVSVSSGYPYQLNKEVIVKIDNQKEQRLFIRDELAWAYDSKQDAALVAAMKRGNRMTVRGTSRKDSYSLDTYSLKGFTRAYDAMKKSCGN